MPCVCSAFSPPSSAGLKKISSAGHARALLSLESEPLQLALAREIMSKGLSVREAEKRVRRLLKKADPSVKAKEPKIEIDTKDLEEKLTLHLGLQVKNLPNLQCLGENRRLLLIAR